MNLVCADAVGDCSLLSFAMGVEAAGNRGASTLIRVKHVCKGSSGSHVSSHVGVGMNPLFIKSLERARFVVLFWREKLDIPAGIFPRAFSDMPRSCEGSASSADDEAIEGALELRTDGDDWDGVG